MPATKARGGWYIVRSEVHSLEKFGQPDQQYETVDINSLPYQEMQEMLEVRAKIAGGDETEAPRLLDGLIQKLFKSGAWSITHPQTGVPLAPPWENDDYRVLPTEVLLYMVGESMGGDEDAVPPEKGSGR